MPIGKCEEDASGHDVVDEGHAENADLECGKARKKAGLIQDRECLTAAGDNHYWRVLGQKNIALTLLGVDSFDSHELDPAPRHCRQQVEEYHEPPPQRLHTTTVINDPSSFPCTPTTVDAMQSPYPAYLLTANPPS